MQNRHPRFVARSLFFSSSFNSFTEDNENNHRVFDLINGIPTLLGENSKTQPQNDLTSSESEEKSDAAYDQDAASTEDLAIPYISYKLSRNC